LPQSSADGTYNNQAKGRGYNYIYLCVAHQDGDLAIPSVCLEHKAVGEDSARRRCGWFSDP